eukprot:scaffold1158_cov66-Phaeocystis_antarctica.AAC.4
MLAALAACCRSSPVMAVWPLLSAVSSAVWPSQSRSSVDARLVFEQQVHHRVLADSRSHYESGRVLGCAQVDAGTALQQLLSHAQAPTRRGRVQQPERVLS